MNDNKLLYEAVYEGNIPVVNFLLERGFKVNNIDPNSGSTCLTIAVARKDVNMIKFLIDKGADVNIKDRKGMTPLKLAMILKSDEIVNILKKNGAVE